MRHMTEYSPAKTGEYPRIFPYFQNCACCEKYFKDNKHKTLHSVRKYARIFVLGHVWLCSLKLTVFLELCSWKTDHFSEQIMSVDKIYPRMFCAKWRLNCLFIGVDFESLRPCYAGPVNSKYCSGTKLFFLQLVSCFIPFSDLLLFFFFFWQKAYPSFQN